MKLRMMAVKGVVNNIPYTYALLGFITATAFQFTRDGVNTECIKTE